MAVIAMPTADAAANSTALGALYSEQKRDRVSRHTAVLSRWSMASWRWRGEGATGIGSRWPGARHVVDEYASLRGGGWQRFIGEDLGGGTLGVLGLGNIGSSVARIGKAFGMTVIAWSQNLTTDRAAAAGAVLVAKDAAEALDDGTFSLEGNAIVALDIGHTDTDHTTCLHVPSIGLVVAGDAIYNGTHPYLVESDGQGLNDWLAAIDKVEALNPRAVIVGHGPLDPDSSPRHIHETRRYIQDFIRLKDETASAHELYDRMLALYPDRINPGSLWGSANAAKAAQQAKA
jgi:hypothetical protein